MRKISPDKKQIDSTENWGIWEKEPSVFQWYYDQKETCYILSGEAEVEDTNGNRMSFGAGDWVEFEKGMKCTWTIKKDIRKKYRFGD